MKPKKKRRDDEEEEEKLFTGPTDVRWLLLCVRVTNTPGRTGEDKHTSIEAPGRTRVRKQT